MPAPVVLRPEQVPADLICSICMTLPLDPVLTPCEHIFCKWCIQQALERANQCPVDRETCSNHQLQMLQGLSFRIWSGIQVKCAKHSDGCAWTGSIGDYASHKQLCSINSQRDRAIKQAVLEMKRQFEQTISSFEASNASHEQEITQLRQQVQSLEAELRRRPNLPSLFDGTYYFGRENVVQLSQLISRYLEDKPREIDSNRIFNCVRSCYTDLRKNYNDNPKHYRLDMKMLLATCDASTWFTPRQRENIKQWYQEQF